MMMMMIMKTIRDVINKRRIKIKLVMIMRIWIELHRVKDIAVYCINNKNILHLTRIYMYGTSFMSWFINNVTMQRPVLNLAMASKTQGCLRLTCGLLITVF